jgi:ADP-L-glycero-D-manno-heptose 6-epimerase
MRSVVQKSYQQIKSTGKVQLFKSYKPEFADGEQLRDFIFVKDAVAMTLYFLENRAVSGLFNCGTGQARSWKALATAVFAAMDIPPVIEFIEMPESLKGKYQYFTQAQMARMRAAGYSAPFTSLEDGVREYVTDYLAARGSA